MADENMVDFEKLAAEGIEVHPKVRSRFEDEPHEVVRHRLHLHGYPKGHRVKLTAGAADRLRAKGRDAAALAEHFEAHPEGLIVKGLILDEGGYVLNVIDGFEPVSSNMFDDARETVHHYGVVFVHDDRLFAVSFDGVTDNPVPLAQFEITARPGDLACMDFQVDDLEGLKAALVSENGRAGEFIIHRDSDGWSLGNMAWSSAVGDEERSAALRHVTEPGQKRPSENGPAGGLLH